MKKKDELRICEIVQGFVNEGRNEVIRKVLESKLVTPEQIADILMIPVDEVRENNKKDSS